MPVWNQIPLCYGMAFHSKTETIENTGVAFSDWKSNQKTYEQIQGIVIDVKELMKSVAFKDEGKIAVLAKCIENYVE